MLNSPKHDAARLTEAPKLAQYPPFVRVYFVWWRSSKMLFNAICSISNLQINRDDWTGIQKQVKKSSLNDNSRPLSTLLTGICWPLNNVRFLVTKCKSLSDLASRHRSWTATSKNSRLLTCTVAYYITTVSGTVESSPDLLTLGLTLNSLYFCYLHLVHLNLALFIFFISLPISISFALYFVLNMQELIPVQNSYCSSPLHLSRYVLISLGLGTTKVYC